MHILVANETVRCAVVITGSATVSELKEKVQKQTNLQAEAMVLSIHGDTLCDEMTLAESHVRDRDRVELSVRSSQQAAEGDSSADTLGPVLNALDAATARLDQLEQLVSTDGVHQEYFTRVLEGLDNLAIDGCASSRFASSQPAVCPLTHPPFPRPRVFRLTDTQRATVRPMRKALVKRCEELSKRALEADGHGG